MDLEALALAVDDRIRVPAADRGSGRLYAVRAECRPAGDDDDDDDDNGGGAAGHPAVILELLAEGEARAIPRGVRPPAGARAIALSSGVRVAPLDPAGANRPPSRHPERRRAHLTVVVGGEGGVDAVEVSVLRYGDGAPTVLRGGTGVVRQRMLRCWSRRPDAPGPASRHPPAA